MYTRRAFSTIAQLFNCVPFFLYNARRNVSKCVHLSPCIVAVKPHNIQFFNMLKMNNEYTHMYNNN